MENAKYDVFISYSRKDYVDDHQNIIPGNVVSKIMDALAQAGITYWFDKEEIKPGENFVKEIGTNIKSSKILLFLSTENANQSDWTSREIACADKYRKHIIPVRIDSSDYDTGVMFLIGNHNSIDYYTNPEKGLTEMVDSIKNYIKQEEEELIKNIRSSNNELNEKEETLMKERDELLSKTEEVSDIKKRETLQTEIQEGSHIFKYKERIRLLKEIKKLKREKEEDNIAKSEELQKKNEQIKQLEEDLQKTKIELEPYLTEAKRKAEARGEFTIYDVSFKMILVEGGTFTMGAKLGKRVQPKEYFPHQISLSSYSIGETEVTQELWEAVMGSNPSSHKGANLPVEGISWEDCNRFVDKLNSITGKNFRLPTEAEWEFAARGGNKSHDYRYSGSNILNDVAWYEKNSSDKTHPVKTKLQNELGLYDMCGNVWEWCQDWYEEDYYSSSPHINPIGPLSGSNRTIRGGCYKTSTPTNFHVAYRRYNPPTDKSSTVGFRLAL